MEVKVSLIEHRLINSFLILKVLQHIFDVWVNDLELQPHFDSVLQWTFDKGFEEHEDNQEPREVPNPWSKSY
jgi:hypothetical protein